MNYLLERAGLTGQVALEFKSEPTEVLSALLADPSAVGVLPEPFKTAAIAKSEGKLSAPVSLTDVWDELAGDTGSRLLTGVTVVRRAFAEEHPEAVAEFLSCHAASVEAVNAARRTGLRPWSMRASWITPRLPKRRFPGACSCARRGRI